MDAVLVSSRLYCIHVFHLGNVETLSKLIATMRPTKENINANLRCSVGIQLMYSVIQVVVEESVS